METRYRVWIVRYEGQRPSEWHDVPADAVAIEPAEHRALSSCQAQRYVEAFNRAAETGPRKVWAVALPVVVRYTGDPEPETPLSTL